MLRCSLPQGQLKMKSGSSLQQHLAAHPGSFNFRITHKVQAYLGRLVNQMRPRGRMMKHCEILTNIFLNFQATWFWELVVLGGRVSLLGSKERQVMKNFCSLNRFKVAKEEMNRKITLVQRRSTPQGGWSSSCRVGKMEPTPGDTYSMGVYRLTGVPQIQNCETALRAPTKHCDLRSCWGMEFLSRLKAQTTMKRSKIA